MKKFATLLMLLSLTLFGVGCTGDDATTNGDADGTATDADADGTATDADADGTDTAE